MDLKKIKEIIDIPLLSEDVKESLIIDEISKDENSISTILLILNAERKRKDELLCKINLLLSKADVALKEPNLNKDGFIEKEISEFYYESEIIHCFKENKK